MEYSGNKEHMYSAFGDHQSAPFQLDVSDIASESSHDTFNGRVKKRESHTHVDGYHEGGFIGDDSFHALESYVGSDDEDERSLLESVSTVSEHEYQTHYEYANQSNDLRAVENDPTTQTGYRTNTRACRKSHFVSPVSQPINFHRPLPLRSYESEATMFPTAGAQAKSSCDRSQSVTSVVASRRPATETMPLPSLPQSNRAQKVRVEGNHPESCREDSHTKIFEQVEHQGLLSQRSSSASTLAAFPIPPMNNPVGELPMLLSRVTSPPEGMDEATSHSVATSISHEDIYRAITTVNMASLLQRTRARGDQLQVIDWAKLSSFERAWREMNEIFISTIYGRKDVVLTDEDVEYIDCVVRVLRSGHDDIASSNWVRRMFERTA
ncbi:hypothetical protein N0V94_005320 [Neodidymelliopsis sp. IMI 364377]|nr:hypothetical protein N0V94_005320 [Neodidymelliopsis sp. IMI 364377]